MAAVVKPWKRDLAYIREVGPDEPRFDEAVQRVWDELEVGQKRVRAHYYVDRDYHNDYVGRLEERIAELKDRCEALEKALREIESLPDQSESYSYADTSVRIAREALS